jgi:hypothetical protein
MVVMANPDERVEEITERVVEVEEKASIGKARPRLKESRSGASHVATETKPTIVVKPRRSGGRR